MTICLGLIGPEDAVQLMAEVVEEYPDIFDYQAFSYDTLQEKILLEIVKSKGQGLDAFLFSGFLPYRIAIEGLTIKKPCFYVPYNAVCIYKTLWYMKEEGFSLDTISFDMISKKSIEEALQEVGLKETTVYNVEYQEGKEISPQDLATWHENLWKLGKIRAAITCLYSTHQLLKEWGVPSFRVLYPKAVIRQTLEQIRFDITNRRLKATQIAIMLINIDNFTTVIKEHESEYVVQRIKLKLLNILLDYAQSIQGSVFSFGGDEYIIFTTRGAIATGALDYKSTSLLKHVQEELSIRISCGIGFDRTVYGSEMNARVALSYAKESGGDAVFLVEEDGSITGPIGKSSEHRPEVDEEVTRIAHHVGLNPTYIRKLKSIQEEIGEDRVHAKKLASYLNVTERSARRILSILKEKGFAKEVGRETSGKKGRPRNIYRIRL